MISNLEYPMTANQLVTKNWIQMLCFEYRKSRAMKKRQKMQEKRERLINIIENDCVVSMIIDPEQRRRTARETVMRFNQYVY